MICKVKDIDLSNNLLNLTIPTNFLDAVPIQQIINVDLSSNGIPGVLPTELDRFDNLLIKLGDNKLSCEESEYGCNGGESSGYAMKPIVSIVVYMIVIISYCFI